MAEKRLLFITVGNFKEHETNGDKIHLILKTHPISHPITLYYTKEEEAKKNTEEYIRFSHNDNSFLK